jgi:O-antigen ligase
MPALIKSIKIRLNRLFGKKDTADRDFLLVLFSVVLVAGLMSVLLGPWKAVAVTVAAAVLVAAFLKPEAALLALAVYTPLEPFLLKFVSDDVYVFARYLPEVLIYVLLASVAARMVFRKRKLAKTPIDLPFVFFLLVAVTSLVVNLVPPLYGILGLRQIIRFILIFFIVVYLNPKREFIRRFTWVMLMVVFFEGVLGLFQAFVGAPMDEFLIPSERKFYESIQLTSGTTQFWSPGSRVFATLGRFDQLGTFLGFFFLIAAGLAYQAKDMVTKKRLLLIIMLAFPAFVLTLSRASWFGFAVGLFVIGVLLMRDNRVRLAFAALAILAVGYLAYSGLAVRYLIDYPEQTAVERFFEAFSYERWRGEYYGMGRLFWIVQTVAVVVPSSPLFGVGPGQYGGGAAAALGNARAYQELNLPFGVYGTEGYIDNNWFSLWGETGTLGLVFYVWMFVALGLMALRVFRRSKDPLARGLALGFIGCLFCVAFQAFLATYLEVRTLALYLWLYAAFVYVLGRRERLTGRR